MIAGQYNYWRPTAGLEFQRQKYGDRNSEGRKAKKSKSRKEKSEENRMTSRKGTEVCMRKILDGGKQRRLNWWMEGRSRTIEWKWLHEKNGRHQFSMGKRWWDMKKTSVLNGRPRHTKQMQVNWINAVSGRLIERTADRSAGDWSIQYFKVWKDRHVTQLIKQWLGYMR